MSVWCASFQREHFPSSALSYDATEPGLFSSVRYLQLVAPLMPLLQIAIPRIFTRPIATTCRHRCDDGSLAQRCVLRVLPCAASSARAHLRPGHLMVFPCFSWLSQLRPLFEKAFILSSLHLNANGQVMPALSQTCSSSPRCLVSPWPFNARAKHLAEVVRQSMLLLLVPFLLSLYL